MIISFIMPTLEAAMRWWWIPFPQHSHAECSLAKRTSQFTCFYTRGSMLCPPGAAPALARTSLAWRSEFCIMMMTDDPASAACPPLVPPQL